MAVAKKLQVSLVFDAWWMVDACMAHPLSSTCSVQKTTNNLEVGWLNVCSGANTYNIRNANGCGTQEDKREWPA